MSAAFVQPGATGSAPLIVWVTTRPNKRTTEVQMGLFVGLPVLRYLFDHGDPAGRPEGMIYLQYPENWLNTIELRSLTRLLSEKCPGQPVRILTHSEHIICTVRREDVYILDEAFPEQEAIQGRRPFYNPQSPSIYSSLPTRHSPLPRREE